MAADALPALAAEAAWLSALPTADETAAAAGVAATLARSAMAANRAKLGPEVLRMKILI
jgi:hypothetical protein